MTWQVFFLPSAVVVGKGGSLAQVRWPDPLAITHATITMMKEHGRQSWRSAVQRWRSASLFLLSNEKSRRKIKERDASPLLDKAAWGLEVLLNITCWQGDREWATGCFASPALATIASISSFDSSPQPRSTTSGCHLSTLHMQKHSKPPVSSTTQPRVTRMCLIWAFRRLSIKNIAHALIQLETWGLFDSIKTLC